MEPLGLNDVAAVAALHAECFARSWPASEVTTMLATPGTVAWGQYDGGELVTLLIMRIGGDTADILTLAVASSQRRRGHALSLLVHADNALRAQSVERVMLEVAVTNQAAIQLYQQHGFHKLTIRPSYYQQADGSREDAVIMEKML